MAQGTSEIDRSKDTTTDELRMQIEQTRAEMTETINAIHARLSPGQPARDATEIIKSAAVAPLTAGVVAATMAAMGIRYLRRPPARTPRWKRGMTAAACIGLVCCGAAALRVRNTMGRLPGFPS